jgi:hypothetical protein
MATFIFVLAGLAGLTMAANAISHTRRVKTVLAKTQSRNHLPTMVSALILTVQFSELLRVIDHASVTHIVGALLVLAVMLATKAGTEGEVLPKH